MDGTHKNVVLLNGTKILQAGNHVWNCIYAPCLGVIVRTGFGTAQVQLVRTMIFSTERFSANNLESFLFIGFLLMIFSTERFSGEQPGVILIHRLPAYLRHFRDLVCVDER